MAWTIEGGLVLHRLFVVGMAFVAIGAGPPQAPPPREIPVAELVRQLGSPDPRVRDAATARLAALVVGPPPELLAAANSTDPDVRERATRAIRSSRTEARLSRWRRFAEQGRVDLFIAASAAWDLPADDPRLWPPAHALGRQIIVRANQDRDNRPHNCPSSFPEYDFYHQRFGVVYTLQNQRYVQPDPQDEDPPVLNRNRAVMALGVTAATGIQGSLIVSRGDVQCTGIQTSVILANGDVTAPGGIFSSVIVSDGDVTVDRRSTGRVIIVARGNIRTSDGAAQSFFAACGQVTIGEKIRGTGTRVNTIEQNVKAPLGVRFFELSDVGLTVRAADGTVTVDAVADGSSCARAGVRAGDTFLTVNGRRPVSAESLRRLLRDALGPGDAAVRLGRGAETVVATVALPD